MGHSDMMEEGGVRQEVGCDRSRLALWSASCQERESTEGEIARLTHSANIFIIFMPKTWSEDALKLFFWDVHNSAEMLSFVNE